ncbi:hypothetical protein GJ496_011537 [Pomphorhynchus laevis]|nr:hypothetical protein GJ496_011537 [Pomphorhynchus laevis]
MKSFFSKFFRSYRNSHSSDFERSQSTTITDVDSYDFLSSNMCGSALYKCRLSLDYARLENQIPIQISLHYQIGKIFYKSFQPCLATRHFIACIQLFNKLDKTQNKILRIR